jgi:hypothetical protein
MTCWGWTMLQFTLVSANRPTQIASKIGSLTHPSHWYWYWYWYL